MSKIARAETKKIYEKYSLNEKGGFRKVKFPDLAAAVLDAFDLGYKEGKKHINKQPLPTPQKFSSVLEGAVTKGNIKCTQQMEYARAIIDSLFQDFSDFLMVENEMCPCADESTVEQYKILKEIIALSDRFAELDKIITEKYG